MLWSLISFVTFVRKFRVPEITDLMCESTVRESTPCAYRSSGTYPRDWCRSAVLNQGRTDLNTDD